MRFAGWCLILAGIAGITFGIFASAAVDTGLGDVNNLGLLNDKAIIAGAGGAFFVGGCVLLAAQAVADQIRDALGKKPADAVSADGQF